MKQKSYKLELKYKFWKLEMKYKCSNFRSLDKNANFRSLNGNMIMKVVKFEWQMINFLLSHFNAKELILSFIQKITSLLLFTIRMNGKCTIAKIKATNKMNATIRIVSL